MLHLQQLRVHRAAAVLRHRSACSRNACVQTRCQAAPKDAHLRLAARAAVDKYVKDNSIVGLGTGDLVTLVADYLGEKLAMGKLQNVRAVGATDASCHEAAFCGIPLLSLEQAAKVDVAIEQADQVHVAANAFIKGISATPVQPQLHKTRELIKAADDLVVLAHSADCVTRLGGTLPVVISADDWEAPAEEVDDIFLGDAELWRRPMSGTSSNPRGGDNPYVSPEGHTIIDIRFYEGLKLYGEDAEYGAIAREIEGVEGLVAHGLLLGLASAVVVAKPGAEAPEVVQLERKVAASS